MPERCSKFAEKLKGLKDSQLCEMFCMSGIFPLVMMLGDLLKRKGSERTRCEVGGCLRFVVKLQGSLRSALDE